METNWTDIMAMRGPAYRAPAEDEVLDLYSKVEEAANDLAAAISTRAQEYRAAGQSLPDAAMASPDWNLALLYSLHQAVRVATERADGAAKAAGIGGATYSQLGAAWGGISRQAARKKWPGVVDARDGEPERIVVELYGGRVEVSYLPDKSAWWWLGEAGSGKYGESWEKSYDTAAEASAAAGAWLYANQKAEAR